MLALAVRTADAPCIERLTAEQVATLLEELASRRGEQLAISVPEPERPIAELSGPARRATAEALKPPR